MTIKKLISIELKKMDMKKYVCHVGIANVGIACLVLMTAILIFVSGDEMPVKIATVTVIDTLVKSVFIVWESILIANLIIEEFRSKTVLLLFSYPISRKRVILSKLIIISGLITVSMVFSQVFQNLLFFALNHFLPLINYHLTLSEVGLTCVTTITSVLLGLLPMYVGMLKKSTVATVVSSIAIVSLTVSSGGSDGSGLITVIPVSLTMAVVGVLLAYMAVKKMLSEDIIL
ncbi:ABC transporter permease [Pseudolactococcus yaeyamensis]